MRANILVGAVALLFAPVIYAVPPIHHWTLDNGVQVYLVEARQLPMVQLRLVFDAAASRDVPARRGAACLTNRLLRDGTEQLDADQVAERFESLGAEFGTACERDMAIVDLRSLTEPDLLEPALSLFAQVVASPKFPEEALERERARTLVALQHAEENPASVVGKAFFKLTYGDHPYSHEPLGSPSDLKAITRADLVNHHKRYYVGRNAYLAIVGDVDMKEARRIANQTVGKLAPGEKAPSLPPAPAIHDPRREFISFPASQSHLRLGQAGVTRDDPDYYPLYVGNYILGGGGLVSRLSDEIREKRGLSYSVYSYFTPMRVRGPFIIGLQTKNSQRDEALEIVRRVVKKFIAEGPTQQELAAAKKHLTGGFPLRLDSNSKIADSLAVIGFYGLPLTYLDEFIPRVEAVTAVQIGDAFRRHIDLEKMVTVMVGGTS